MTEEMWHAYWTIYPLHDRWWQSDNISIAVLRQTCAQESRQTQVQSDDDVLGLELETINRTWATSQVVVLIVPGIFHLCSSVVSLSFVIIFLFLLSLRIIMLLIMYFPMGRNSMVSFEEICQANSPEVIGGYDQEEGLMLKTDPHHLWQTACWKLRTRRTPTL